MIRRSLGWFSVRYRYLNPVDRQRATTLLRMTWVATIAWLVTTLAFNIPEMLGGKLEAGTVMLTILPPLPLYLIYRFVQTGALNRAILLFVGLTIVGSLPFGDIDGTDFVVLTIPLVAAGLLLNRRGIAVVTVVLAAIFLSVVSVSRTAVSAGDFAFMALVVALDVAFLYIFNTDIRLFVTESLTNTSQLQQMADFLGRREADDSEEDILQRAMQLIRDLFDLSHVQVYLLDEDGKLAGRVRSGLGVDLVIVRQSFELDAASAIAEAARAIQPVMVTPADHAIRRSHLLPATTVGLAVPLVYGQRVIGVLDAQSESRARFTPNQTTMLTLITNQVALLVAQARVLTVTRQSLQEQAAIVDNLRGQLQALRRVGRDDLASTWEDYFQRRGETAIGFDLRPGEAVPVSASDLPDALRAALDQPQIAVETRGDERIIKVPILLQGETLGAMAFTVPRDQLVSERQLEMAQDIASRLAQALETKRLFEQSEAQALRERKASETASLLVSATDVRAVLNLAAESFNEALGAIRTQIYLQPGILGELAAPDGSIEEAK